MPEVVQATQPELPLAQSRPAKFIIPDDKIVAEDGDRPIQNTTEQAPVAPQEGEVEQKEEVTPEQAAKREGRRFERKLDKAYKRAAEAQARAELLQQELEKQRQSSQQPKAEGEPTLAQFDYDPEKYAEAKAKFAAAQVQKEVEAKQRSESQKQEYQRLVSAWEEKTSRAEDKYDDFDVVVGELQPNTPFVAAIMEAENGEDIAYHLGKNPKEAERIARLSPLAQVREIGKLEAKLSAEPEKPKAPSKAPPPVAPLTGAATPDTRGLDNPELSDKEWIEKRQKQLARRRR